MEIKIMSIDKLLQKAWMQNSFKEAILFLSTRPNYYNFGSTWFYSLDILDTDDPVIKDIHIRIIQELLDKAKKLNTMPACNVIYVCCDAGISRSPAIALFLAHKLNLVEQIKKIEETYRFLNISLFKKLMGLKWN